MDWLVARQDRIQQKLAARHLQDGGLVLYDLTSSYFEGACCPLAKRGYSRDGKRGTLHVNYVVITNAGGCPVAVSVYDGNTADSRTLLPAVQQVRADFGIAHVVRVGDVPPSEVATESVSQESWLGITRQAAAYLSERSFRIPRRHETRSGCFAFGEHA